MNERINKAFKKFIAMHFMADIDDIEEVDGFFGITDEEDVFHIIASCPDSWDDHPDREEFEEAMFKIFENKPPVDQKIRLDAIHIKVIRDGAGIVKYHNNCFDD